MTTTVRDTPFHGRSDYPSGPSTLGVREVLFLSFVLVHTRANSFGDTESTLRGEGWATSWGLVLRGSPTKGPLRTEGVRYVLFCVWFETKFTRDYVKSHLLTRRRFLGLVLVDLRRRTGADTDDIDGHPSGTEVEDGNRRLVPQGRGSG